MGCIPARGRPAGRGDLVVDIGAGAKAAAVAGQDHGPDVGEVALKLVEGVVEIQGQPSVQRVEHLRSIHADNADVLDPLHFHIFISHDYLPLWPGPAYGCAPDWDGRGQAYVWLSSGGMPSHSVRISVVCSPSRGVRRRDGGGRLGQPVRRPGVLGHAEIGMIHLLQEVPFAVLGVADHVLVVLDRACRQPGPLQHPRRLLRRQRGGPGPDRIGDRGVVAGIGRAGHLRQLLPVAVILGLDGQPASSPRPRTTMPGGGSSPGSCPLTR